jgi:hypothetical protein
MELPMPDPDWNNMSIDEKLNWLRAAIVGVINTANHNLDARVVQHNQVIERLDMVEEAVRNISLQTGAIQTT